MKEFESVEQTEDRVCEIMELFCEVQAEICEEMVNKDQLQDALDEMEGLISSTNRSNAPHA